MRLLLVELEPRRGAGLGKTTRGGTVPSIIPEIGGAASRSLLPKGTIAAKAEVGVRPFNWFAEQVRMFGIR